MANDNGHSFSYGHPTCRCCLRGRVPTMTEGSNLRSGTKQTHSDQSGDSWSNKKLQCQLSKKIFVAPTKGGLTVCATNPYATRALPGHPGLPEPAIVRHSQIGV